jgi:hypothetical protein
VTAQRIQRAGGQRTLIKRRKNSDQNPHSRGRPGDDGFAQDGLGNGRF